MTIMTSWRHDIKTIFCSWLLLLLPALPSFSCRSFCCPCAVASAAVSCHAISCRCNFRPEDLDRLFETAKEALLLSSSPSPSSVSAAAAEACEVIVLGVCRTLVCDVRRVSCERKVLPSAAWLLRPHLDFVVATPCYTLCRILGRCCKRVSNVAVLGASSHSGWSNVCM